MHVHVVEKERIDKERINALIFLEVVLAIEIIVSNLEKKVNASILKDDFSSRTDPSIFTSIAGLQIIFQNMSGIMSGRNEIPSDIYENLSDINFYKNFIKS